MTEQDKINEEKKIFAIALHDSYLEFRKKIENALANPEEILSIGGIETMLVRARALYACAVRMSGVKYTDMAIAFNLTRTRCRDIAIKGRRVRYLNMSKYEDRIHFSDIFDAKGFVELSFASHENMVEVEKFCADAKAKLKALR